MKKIQLFLAVFGLIFSSVSVAQNVESDRREEITFGLKAGLNYSNVYNSQTEEFRADNKFGFAGGLFLTVPIGKFLGVQPEILISQKGFKGEGVLFGSTYSMTRTSTFVDVPLQVALKPSEFITLVAGPQFSYLIRQKDSFDSSLASYSQEQEFENDNIRKNIIGLVFGLDIHVKHVAVGTRLGWDVTNNHGDGTSNTPRYKNSWFQATLGFIF